MTSWIDSAITPETKALRFDGDEDQEAWPSDAFVHVRARPTVGDERFLQERLYFKREKENGEIILDTLWYEGQLSQCAQFIVSVEGDCFTDPDTGKPLDFSGDFSDRRSTALRLPVPVRIFVSNEIDKLSADPLGLKRNDSDGSTKPSRSSRSQKDHLKLAR